MSRIRCVRPEYHESGSWRLLHDNALSHRSTLITDFFIKNGILTINHSPYSPDMAPCDYYLFNKLHLAMVNVMRTLKISKTTIAILNMISKDEIKKSFDMLLDRAKLLY